MNAATSTTRVPPTVDASQTRRSQRQGRPAYAVLTLGPLGVALSGITSLPRSLVITTLPLVDMPALLASLGQPHLPQQMPRRAVPVYNATHRLAGPLALGAAAAALTNAALGAAALGWLTHITLDRAVGYTLRNPDRTTR
jgi:hypothetical protein